MDSSHFLKNTTVQLQRIIHHQQQASPKISENITTGRRMAKSLGSTGEFFRRRDEWRKHPMLSNQFRHAVPGLGIALVAFGVYLVGEVAYNKIYAPSHSHSHSTASPSHSH